MTISSRLLSSYLNKIFSFSFGDKKKNGTIIPEEILKNDNLLQACIRGLVDTDGTIAKSGTNLKLVFTSHNKPLLEQLNTINYRLKLFNRIYINQLETCSIKKINRYMRIIGSSNLRNIIVFNEKMKRNKLLYKKEVPDYYPRYRNIKIPFYGPVV